MTTQVQNDNYYASKQPIIEMGYKGLWKLGLCILNLK